MKIWIYFFLDFILLDFVLSTTSTHLYTEVDGNLRDNFRIFINIDILDSSGLMLYAIDNEFNTFTIERKVLFDRTSELIFNFNGHEHKEIEINDNPCPVVKYKILIQLIEENLAIGNDNKIILRKIYNKSSSSDHFQKYPIPESVLKYKKTYFCIGNISPIIGLKRLPPLKHQLIGCMNGLYIHSKLKSLQYWSSGGDDISETCWHNYTENQCNRTKCKKTAKKVYNLDCRLSVMNVKEFCYKNLLPYDEKINSFQNLKNVSEITRVKLIWKQEYPGNYCLIEITLSNMVSVLFFTNTNDEIYYCIKTKSSNCTLVILEKSFFSSTNHLIITLENHVMNLKISNGTFYKAYDDEISGYIETINIGYSQFSNDICIKYQGNMIFFYSYFQFKPIMKDPIKTNDKIKDFKVEFTNFNSIMIEIPIWIILVFIGVILLQSVVLLSCVIHCCCKRKPYIKQQSNDPYNVYEQGNIQQRSLPNAPQNNANETEIYSMIDKYER